MTGLDIKLDSFLPKKSRSSFQSKQHRGSKGWEYLSVAAVFSVQVGLLSCRDGWSSNLKKILVMGPYNIVDGRNPKQPPGM